MIGLDSDVLVRYIMQDDSGQSARATRLVESLTAQAPGFISLVVCVELIWVLTSAYGLGRRQIADTLDALLRSQELVIDRVDLIARAQRGFRSGSADFSDYLIQQIALDAGCKATMTFDRKAARSAGMTLVS